MLKHVPRHVLRDVPVRHVLGLKFVISTALLGGTLLMSRMTVSS